MLESCIEKLKLKEELSAAEISASIEEMLSVKDPDKCASFLSLLRQKGETADDLEAFVRCMRGKMQSLSYDKPVLDIVGTGGDGFDTINVSTSSALLAASCGVPVLKHGNRSVSSLTGSADLMEAFGYNLELSDETLLASLDQYQFGFAYAPKFHPSFAAIKPIRKKMGTPTIFNLIGPLLNPASAPYILMGVGDKRYLPIMAQALQQLGIKHGLVFNGCGLDEVSTVGPVDVIEIKGKTSESYQLSPEDYGFKLCSVEDLRGGDAQENKRLISEVLQGKSGPIADTLVFNAGLACYIYGVSDTIEAGIKLALMKQQGGDAYRLLQDVIKHSQGEVPHRLRPPACPEGPRMNEMLKKIVAQKEIEVKQLKLVEVKRTPKDFKQLISGPGLSFIAEIKRRSPSKGNLAEIKNPEVLLDQYVAGGADAISVLTDEKFFGGSLADCEKVAAKLVDSRVCVLRKDFIIDERQIIQSMAAGADVILLIVAILRGKTKQLLDFAKNEGISAIVEVHTDEELEIAIAADAEIIGINNRDLDTFEVDIGNCLRLVKGVPDSVLKIAESAIYTQEDIRRVKQAGFDAVLIGEALVTADNPEEKLKALKAVT